MNRTTLTWTLLTAGLLASVVLAPPAGAQGETIVVTTRKDRWDFGGARQVADLPGPDGVVSFREACTAANNTPGPQTIHFAIPRSEWETWQDIAYLEVDTGTFLLTDDETTVDMQTQTAFTGDTNPDGWEVGIENFDPNGYNSSGIVIYGSRCIVRGLDEVRGRRYSVDIAGHDNRVVGCTISGAPVIIWGGFNGAPPTGNVIGGTQPADRNRLNGIRIEGPADRNLVVGNEITVLGVQVLSAARYGQIAYDNVVRGNAIYGVGYYGEEGFPTGEQVQVIDSVGTVIEKNLIGILPDGVTPAKQIGPTGVLVRGAQGTILRGNVIGAMRTVGANHYQGQLFGQAIDVGDDSSGTMITGNLIGTDITGTQPIPNLYGIRVGSISYNTPPRGVVIGGQEAAGGNLIAFNERSAVRVHAPAVAATITGNSIHSNGELGIDLVTNDPGVTPNDPGDADTGANDLQNFPVLADSLVLGRHTRVVGTLDSHPDSTYTIELFANTVCDPSGFGEGERFLGATTVVTDDQGRVRFVAYLDGETQPGDFVTATATDASGNTSEFSACIVARERTVGPSGPPVVTK